MRVEVDLQPDRKSWPAVTIRVFAVLNLLMGLLGFAALLDSIIRRLMYNPWPQEPPYLAQAYYVRSIINFFFVILTVVGGIFLWRKRWRGWVICKVLFIGQIAYFLADLFRFPLLLLFGERGRLVSKALGASWGTGNMGTVFQTLTGYPVIALIGLKIAFGKLQPSRATAPPLAPPPSGGSG